MDGQSIWIQVIMVTDYLLHAAVAKFGLGANSPEELYILAHLPISKVKT